MSKQRIDTFASAMHEIDHALRQSCFFQKLDNQNRAERNFLARFKHERVSARDREWEHPHRHHCRKIEWRDADADSQRLQYRLAVDTARKIFERLAFEQGWNAAGELDVLDPAINAAPRFGQSFAVLARDALANAIEILFDQLAITKEDARAFHRWRVAPRRKRVGRGPDRKIDIFFRAHRHFSDDFTARRIEHGRRVDTRKFTPFAGDKNGNASHGSK